MLIHEIIRFCNSEYSNADTHRKCENCQHVGGCSGGCKNCLQEIHYPSGNPTGKKLYDCPNLINFYVCDYSFKYASEIYYLLNKSDSLAQIPCYNIFSIGCGACPDLMAFENYVKKKHPEKKITYRGIDKNPLWKPVHNQVLRYAADEIEYVNLSIEDAFDFFEHFCVGDINVLVLQYIISALYPTEGARAVNKLFDLVIDGVVKYRNKSEPFVIIINDVNSINMGRDLFINLHNKLRTAGLNGRVSQFYFDKNIKVDAQRYGTRHDNSTAMTPEMAAKYQEYEPWQYCTSAQLLIEIGGMRHDH